MRQLGRYRLLEELGSGGFATVYKAELVDQDRYSTPVAIKRIHPFLTHNSPHVVSSLKNEARLSSMIEHPNVVHVFELGSEPDADGQLQYYMVMELVKGKTLDVIRRMSAKKGETLPPSVIVDLLLQIARGLSHVHTLTDDDGNPLQMVHRDLKPGNILVSTEGVAKIFDFGIAKAINSAGPRTATGVTRGTAAYMSPEQAYGKKVSFASDLFAFGAILFELAVGEQLIVADSMASQLMAVVNTPADYRADDVEAAVPGLSSVFVKLRQPDAGDRYGSTQELIEALRAIRRELKDEADPPTYLANLFGDPDAQVSREEMARFRVLGPNVRAPSTATFFELPGYRRDAAGKLVPSNDASRSWGVRTPTNDHQAVPTDPGLTDDLEEIAAPTLLRRLAWVPLLAVPVVLVLLLGMALVWVAGQLRGPAGAVDVDPFAGGAVAEGANADAADGGDADGTSDDRRVDAAADGGTSAATQPRPGERDEPGDDAGPGGAEEPGDADSGAADEPAADDGAAEPDDGAADAAATDSEPATDTPGVLKINAYPAATVYVDGRQMGSTFVTARGIELPAGRHTVKMVRSTDGKEQVLQVVIQPGQEHAVPFQWEP